MYLHALKTVKTNLLWEKIAVYPPPPPNPPMKPTTKPIIKLGFIGAFIIALMK